MSQKQDTIVTALMEQLIAEGPDGMAQVFTALFNLAMRLERERFLGAGLYERNPDRRGYANGYKPKTIHTRVGPLAVEVPQTRGVEFYPSALEKVVRSGHNLGCTLSCSMGRGVERRSRTSSARQESAPEGEEGGLERLTSHV